MNKIKNMLYSIIHNIFKAIILIILNSIVFLVSIIPIICFSIYNIYKYNNYEQAKYYTIGFIIKIYIVFMKKWN